MPLYKDEAIVLFKRAYGESDKIIRLFTLTSGKVAAIAKGANKSQKRFANTLEPFNHIKVEYFDKPGKGMVRIENADIIDTNQGIETSLKKACVASFFTEFLDRLTKERERHDALFHLLKRVIAVTKEIELAYPAILSFQLQMLEMLGYMPNFLSCVYCGVTIKDEEKTLFSKQRGGILCRQCARSIAHERYGQGVIPWFTCLKEGGSIEVNRTFEHDGRDLMEGFMSFHLDVTFKSYRILKTLLP